MDLNINIKFSTHSYFDILSEYWFFVLIRVSSLLTHSCCDVFNYKQLLQLNNYWDVPCIAWVPNTCCSLILLLSLFYLLLWSAVLMFNLDHFFRLMISTYHKYSAYFSTIRYDSAQFNIANNLLKIPSYIFFSDSTRSSMFWHELACFSMTQHDSRCFNKIQHVSTITQKKHAPNKNHQYIASSSSIFYLANLSVRA